MKTTSLYVRFLLINVLKFNVFLNTAQTQSTMCRNCFSFNATLQFSTSQVSKSLFNAVPSLLLRFVAKRFDAVRTRALRRLPLTRTQLVPSGFDRMGRSRGPASSASTRTNCCGAKTAANRTRADASSQQR